MELPPLLEERLKKQWTRQQALLRKEDLQRKYRGVKFTGRIAKEERLFLLKLSVGRIIFRKS